ncbi:transmembrane protein 72 isoform X2 [Erythrolamprus reginae]|uniref:transmembrane protein 72 isoform X2 n=1 Tax=Erythrolamprus reginae TaxID=121349 RepID=UPI00396D03C8
MEQTTLWKVLEYLCRLLGISTGAGLLGVGLDTLLQGRFTSLALYLLISGMAVCLWEVPFFASLLFGPYFAPRRGPTVEACWVRVKRRAAFQKFLSYALLSVACFLSPVHLWQVVLPGTLLILTSLAYFLLSKQRREDLGDGPPEPRGDGVTGDAAEARSRQASRLHRRCPPLPASLRSFCQACRGPFAFTACSGVLSSRKPLDLEGQAEEMALTLRGDPEAKESVSETASILSAQAGE